MDFLRCITPKLVRKEIWTHILAYNLVRTVMAPAASMHNIELRTISFKGLARVGRNHATQARELRPTKLKDLSTERLSASGLNEQLLNAARSEGWLMSAS